jgi:alpha-N-arabinofuranosidase
LGGAFSTISGNVIHDIHVRDQFDGAEMAGIKLHGAIDVQIAHNYIYRTCRGIWLDWMAQGTRVTGNLLDANASDRDLTTETVSGGRQDMFVEVNHGPILVDNNLFLSAVSINIRSQGTAYAHNLFAGAMRIVAMDKRLTPYLKAHSTQVAGLHNNPAGDVRFYNNIFVQRADLSGYNTATLPVEMLGNVFIGKAKPSTQEARPTLEPEANTEVQLIEKPDGVYLQMSFDTTRSDTLRRTLVTTELLGKAAIPNQSFESPDGTPLRIDLDYFGQKRSETDPSPGPFERAAGSRQVIKVWPLPTP